MDKEKLRKILEDDEFGILTIKPKNKSSTTDERLLASFKEINDFIIKTGCLPKPNRDDIAEFSLYNRLMSIKADARKRDALLEHDEFNLFANIKEIKSLQDIFEDDEFGILSDDDLDIFTLKHIPKQQTMPDYIAQRKPCKDFEKYEPLLKECHADLSAGKRRLRPFANEKQISKGMFFVLSGILLYVAEVGKLKYINNHQNRRLRCIFDNGTESDMLLRSLAAGLYKDGERVTEQEDPTLEMLRQHKEENPSTGYIYVLKSLSKKPEIASLQNLFKIGFSRIPVEERIKTAEKEPTFLMAPVSIVSAFQCFDVNPQKLEQLLHSFFGHSCLNIDVFDQDGKRCTPREWFIAPLKVIKLAVNLIINGEIVHYRYDTELQDVVLRK